MFQSARIKLTAWYLLIIMLISIVFSLVIFNGISREFERFEHVQKLRIERERILQISPLWDNHEFDPEIISQARMRLMFTLIFVNLGILCVSGIAGYFLADRTLRPIKEMIDDQNRFITDASHELRTPLTSLKTSIEVNLRDKNLNLRKARKLIESNLDEVNSLQTLSDGLIRLAQYQKPNDSFKFETVSISEITDDAIGKVKPLAQKKMINIEAKISDIYLEGDKKSLVELFIILLDNAIKYSRDNSSVKISSEKTDNHVTIAVSDQGIGMENKDIPYIFDRFYRAEKSRSKEVIPGYGLGLSIAKKIIDMHSGTIEFKSKANEGTTFIIQLPLFV